MGTPTPFELLVRAHFSYVHRLARAFGAPDREAEDVCQEVFHAFHAALERKLLRSSDPLPWLRGTTYRIAQGHRRALARQGSPTELGAGEHDVMDQHLHADTERLAALHAGWALVFKLLEPLDYDRRVVFVLHEIEGLTLEQIAADLKIPLTTVWSRLRPPPLPRLGFEQSASPTPPMSVTARRPLRAPLSLRTPAPRLPADADGDEMPASSAATPTRSSRRTTPSPGALPAADDELEIPITLVGEIHLEGILTVAKLTGRSPVTVLRGALDAGLHGGEPMLSPAELRTLRELVDQLPGIARELGLEDEAPVSGEIGGALPAG